MELDKFKTMMNVRERMTYFLRFQRMAGSENQVTIDEETWKLVLPDQWNLTSKHEKAIRESLETFVHDINKIENKRARKYFIIHYCYIPTLSLKKYKRAANPLRDKGFRCSLISFRCCIWSFGVIFEFFKLHEPFVPFHAQ